MDLPCRKRGYETLYDSGKLYNCRFYRVASQNLKISWFYQPVQPERVRQHRLVEQWPEPRPDRRQEVVQVREHGPRGAREEDRPPGPEPQVGPGEQRRRHHHRQPDVHAPEGHSATDSPAGLKGLRPRRCSHSRKHGEASRSISDACRLRWD